MKAFVFPGQGSQFVGMGKDLYDNNPLAKQLFDKADEVLGFKITDIMFAGTDEQLKEIRLRLSDASCNKSALAREYGVSYQTIHKLSK